MGGVRICRRRSSQCRFAVLGWTGLVLGQVRLGDMVVWESPSNQWIRQLGSRDLC